MDITLERILNCIGPGHGSAKALADALGIHPQIITNWKCGPSKSYRKYLPQIAAYFDVSVDYLLGKTDIKKETPVHGDDEIIRLDADELEFIREIRERPEMKIMFSVTKNVTMEDLIKAVKIAEALKAAEEGGTDAL